MKKILHILLILSLGTSTLAQDDQVAKRILDDFSSKTKTYKCIKAGFTLTSIDLKEETSDTYEGNITIKGEKFRLNVMDSETYFDGETLWNYLPDVNEVNISEPDPEDYIIQNNPFRLFDEYQAKFKYKYIGEISEAGKIQYEIDLFPINIEQEYSRIKIRIEKTSMDLHSAKYFRKDGYHFLVEISGMTANPEIPDSHFTFIPSDHPGVEIIDLR